MPLASPLPQTPQCPPRPGTSRVANVPSSCRWTAYVTGVPPSKSISMRQPPEKASRANLAGGAGRASSRALSLASRAARLAPSSTSGSASAMAKDPTQHGSSCPSRTVPLSCPHRNPSRTPVARSVQSAIRMLTSMVSDRAPWLPGLAKALARQRPPPP
eukprot:scaffold14682_cov124-Isochrysis_galbana.AAC.7